MTLITSIQPRPEPTGRADGAADAADAVEFTVPDCVIQTAEAVAARFGSTLADILFMALRTGLASAGSIGLVARSTATAGTGQPRASSSDGRNDVRRPIQ